MWKDDFFRTRSSFFFWIKIRNLYEDVYVLAVLDKRGMVEVLAEKQIWQRLLKHCAMEQKAKELVGEAG